jgi:hypothetical protein
MTSFANQVTRETFQQRLNQPNFDTGNTLRSMLFKKGRGRSNIFFRPWTERYCILDRSVLYLKYYDISRCDGCYIYI